MKALTPGQIDQLFGSVSDPQLRAMILLGYRHGMRASEICGLLWADVSLVRKTITVRRLKRSLTTVQPLCEAEVEALRGIYQENANPRVFPISRVTFWRRFRNAANAIGLPVANPHCLKHSLGYALVRANVNLAVVKQALGHRNIANTAIYAVPTDAEVGALVANALK